jgi:hypothetical protein
LTIARTLQDYADLAYQLIGAAGREKRLASVRARLSIDRKKAPLFDTRRLVGEVERGLRMAWEVGDADAWESGGVGMHVVVRK